jgi:hypothetical protein
VATASTRAVSCGFIIIAGTSNLIGKIMDISYYDTHEQLDESGRTHEGHQSVPSATLTLRTKSCTVKQAIRVPNFQRKSVLKCKYSACALVCQSSKKSEREDIHYSACLYQT